MKKILSVIFVFAVLSAKAQTGAYTLVNGNWEYKFVKIDSGYRGPVDTLASAPISATAVKGTTLYIKGSDGFWHAITGAGGSGVWGFISGSLPAQTDLAAKFGTKYDTTVRKLDTLYAITDSTLGFYTNGLFHTFKFKGTLTSFNGRNGAIVLTLADVSSAIGFVPANLSSVINALQVVNAGGATSIRVDVIANRPAAGTFGRMFIATDALTLTVDNGSSWLTIAGGGGGGVSTATGDASGAAVGTNLPLTLATVNSNVGVFGDASHVSQMTATAKGLITAAVAVSIQISESQVTNLVSDLAGKQATGNYLTALTGDVTAAGPGSAAATIATNAVTNAKAAQMGATTIKANVTGSTANAADATPAQIAAILPLFSTSANGLAPTSPGGTTQFLRADGSYAVPPGTGGTTFANPTGTTGLTAVNGSATTAMRSDAAPPLSQAITPIWTNTHTFSLAPILTALNGYVKANTSSAATASTTIPNTDITGLGTASTKNVAASGNAASAEVVKGDDSRLTDSRAPTGSAGGSFMNGTYPNPGIVANSIGNSQASQMGANTIKGNNTGSTANAADLTISQVATMLGSSFQAPGNYVVNTTGAGFLGGSVLASRPTSPSGTGFWYETDNKVLDYWNGSSWVQATQTPGSYVTNLGGSSGINRGAYLSRASASSASNTFYWSTDSVFWSYSDGSSWKDLKSGSGGGGSGNSINARGDTVTNGITQFYTDPNPGNGGWYQMKLMKNTEAALGTLRDTTSTVQYKPGGLGNSMMEHADREIAFVNYMHPKFRSAGVGFLSMGNNRPFVPVQVPGSSWTGRNVFTTPAGRGLDGYDAISNGGADSIVVSVGTQNKGFDFTWGTTVEVFWIGQSGGGTFKIDIDGKGGGSYVTVNTASATGAQRTVISGLTDGPHVVAITSVSEGTNHNIITGLNEYRSVGGWIYEHFAKGSGYTTHFVALNAVEWETQLSWVHPTSIDIDLAVTSVDVVDSAGYRTGVDTIIHRIRAVDSLIDICLYQSTPFSASLGVTQFNRLPSVDRNIKRLAYDDACALWDPSAIYGKTIFSSVYRGAQFNDSIHRTPVGYTAELGLQMGAYGALSNYIPPIRPNFYDNDGDIWTTKVVNLHNNGVRWDSVGTWKIDGKTGNGTMIWDFTNPLQISVNTGGLKVQSDYNWSTSGILNITGTSAANNLSAALTVGGSSLSSSRTLQINNTSYALVAAASASNTAAAGFENRVGTGLTLDGQFYSVKNSISAVQDSNSTSVLGLLGDVNVGAANVHGKLKFFVGGTSAGNEVARFTVNRNLLLNTTTDVPSSILTVSSTTQGILPPAMTTTQMNAIASPANGLLVYNTTAAAFYYWNGSAWGAVGSGGGGSNYQTVQNAGSGLTQRPNLNFLNAATVADNSGNTSTDITTKTLDNSDVTLAANRTITVPASTTLSVAGGGSSSAVNISPTNLNLGSAGSSTFTNIVGVLKMASGTFDNETGTSGVTLPSNYNTYLINPPSTISSTTFTLPSGGSVSDGFMCYILFGGSVSSGAVVTALAIGGGGTTILGTGPTTANAGDVFIYEFRTVPSVGNFWFKIK